MVVATNELEEQRLLDLWERANQNKVPDIELVDARLMLVNAYNRCII